MNRAAILAFGALLLSTAAHAAAPTLNVEQSTTLKAPPAKVWAVIENFSDMSWVPPVKGTTATQGNTPGSVRTIDLGGPKLVETLRGYDAGQMTYNYTINDTEANKMTLPVSNYHSTIKVAPGADGGSVVTWMGTFQRADTSDSPKAGMDDTTATNAVTGVYQAGFSGLKQKTGG